MSAPYLLTLWLLYTKLHSNVPLWWDNMQNSWLSYLDLNVKATVQWHGINPCIRSPLCISLTLSWISLNFSQIFIWVRQCVEPTTWQRRPKVKVTLQENGILLNFNLMFLSVRWFAELRDSMLRSNFTVMGFTLELRFQFISPQRFEFFS